MGFSSSVAKASRKCPTDASLWRPEEEEVEAVSSSLGAPAMRPSPTNYREEEKKGRREGTISQTTRRARGKRRAKETPTYHPSGSNEHLRLSESNEESMHDLVRILSITLASDIRAILQGGVRVEMDVDPDKHSGKG